MRADGIGRRQMKIENNAKQRGERELGVEENEGSKKGVVESGNWKRVSRGRRESRETKVEDEGEEMRCKNKEQRIWEYMDFYSAENQYRVA